jgi:DNA recombination protein RmuC
MIHSNGETILLTTIALEGDQVVLLLLLLLTLAIALLLTMRRLHNTRSGALVQSLQLEDLRAQLQLEQALAAQQQDSAELTVIELNDRLLQFERTLREREQIYTTQVGKIASLETALELQRAGNATQSQLLENAKHQLHSDFELLANRIFDEKTERFDKHSRTSIDGVLNPLREQLQQFRQKIEDVYDKDSRDRVTLRAELGQLKQLNQSMTEEAINLTRALKGDNKVQGNWGEVVLERLLEGSGLRRGYEYDTQVHLISAAGQRRSPDVVLRLPEQRDIVIDSKVSLTDYEQFCNSADEGERQSALKRHASSVRNHINGLSLKDYENLPGLNTLDFVFIFIPIEAAFTAAFDYDQSLFSDAYKKNIVVVGPGSLLATLRTVQSVWRQQRQNKNADEIARQAGAMHDKFVAFVGDLDKISDHLSRASLAHDSAVNKLASGKGNLVASAERLANLGAKTQKSMPTSVRERGPDNNEVQHDNTIEIPTNADR